MIDCEFVIVNYINSRDWIPISSLHFAKKQPYQISLLYAYITMKKKKSTCNNSSGRYFLCSEMIFNLAKSLTASPFFKCCENLASSKSISPCFPTTAMSASIWQWIQYKHWKWIQYKQHLPCISFLVHLIKVHARVQVPFTQKPTKLVDCNIKYIYLAYHATSKHVNEDKVTAPKRNHNKHDNNFHKLQSLSI